MPPLREKRSCHSSLTMENQFIFVIGGDIEEPWNGNLILERLDYEKIKNGWKKFDIKDIFE